MQIPVREKVIYHYSRFGEDKLLETPLIDKVTEKINYSMSRGLRKHDQVINWLLTTCINLKEFQCYNYPEAGIKFQKQQLQLTKTKLEKISIWDYKNKEFFADLISKSKETLRELTYMTVNSDIFLNHLDTNIIKKLYIRDLTSEANTFLLRMSGLQQLKLYYVNSDSEVFRIIKLLPNLDSLKELALKFNYNIPSCIKMSLCDAISRMRSLTSI